MHPIAQEMNQIIREGSPTLYRLLSEFGRHIYMPKGIITQGAEARAHAHRHNATIGIATEGQDPMHLQSVRAYFNRLTPAEIFDYAPPQGVAELRKLWKAKILEDNPAIQNADSLSLPIVTNALTHGLMLAADLFVDRGDIILSPDKLWDNYQLLFEVRYGAKILTYPLFTPSMDGFHIEALDQALAQAPAEKVILLFNFPNNPTGYTPLASEAEQIVQAVVEAAEAGKQILVISDDAYFGLEYEPGLMKGTIFSHLVGAHPNIVAVKVDGFTKEFYVWGFRIGFVTFADYWQKPKVYAALEQKAAACIRCSISNCSRPAQSILLDLMRGDAYKQERAAKYEILRQRAARVKEIVHDPRYADCWEVYPFNSGYFMCLKLKGVDSNALRQHILHHYGVGTISLGESDLRIAFSSVERERIEDLFGVIARGVRELREE